MKTNELKILMVNEKNNKTINNYSESIINNLDNYELDENVFDTPQSKHISYKRKVLIPSLLSAFLAAIILVICIPIFILNKHNTNNSVHPQSESETKLLSSEIVVLSNAIPSDNDTNNNLRLLKALNNEEYKNISEEINYYLIAGNTFLENNIINFEYKINDNKNYNYDYKLIISLNDNGINYEYDAYYNEMRKKDELKIEGILIKNGEEYKIKGETEFDDDEVETELKIYFGKNTYISIKNEIDTEENEYEYKYVRDGKTIKEVEIEAKVEDDKKKTEIEIKENDIEINVEFEYFNDYIVCEYEDDNDKYEVTITISNNKYIYKFEDGTEIIL